MPRATYLATPLQILQSPGNFAIVYQENHAFRVFHPDTRPHFDATDWWMGDTRYRWEGDTLVADVAAMTDQAWLDQSGNFHSTDFHVVERYRLSEVETSTSSTPLAVRGQLPQALKELRDRADKLFERVRRLDARLHGDGAPASPENPVGSQLQALEQAFGRLRR